MKRQITIYESTKNGKLTVFNDVEASNLGELKAFLREKGIDINDKEFVEGITQTGLINDDSKLPENIPFKDTVTNNLFINILQKNNKIKSGMSKYASMSRSELLAAAKPYKAEIEQKFGANYTRVKSGDIVSFLEEKEGTPAVKAQETTETPAAKVHPLVEAILVCADAAGCSEKVKALLDIAVKETPKLKEPESFFSSEDIAKFLKKR